MKNIDQKFSFSILKTFTEEIFISLLLVVCSQQVFAQVAENFDDGSFLENPAWSGSTDLFDASGQELRLNAPPVAGTAYLSTPSSSWLNATWQFHVSLQFNPSGSNFCRLYLTSDQPDLTGALNGYFVLLGGSTDEISLFKQTGTTTQRLIDGRDGLLDFSTTSFSIRVTRDAIGNWALSSNVEDSTVFVPEGFGSDTENLNAAYSGVWCRYTATRSDKFAFDNIVITGNPFIPDPPVAFRNVMITEFFPDPSPRQDLPEYEFVEIFNAGEHRYNLTGWTFSDETQSSQFPNVTIEPGQYLIVTSSSGAESFSSFGKTVGLTSFPTLNNSEDHLILKNAQGTLIDSVHYNEAWYKDDNRDDGGWTFELIDPHNRCGEENNWAFSESEAGGTPGSVNSIAASKPDLEPPSISSLIPLSDSVILIKFNEKLNVEIPLSPSFHFEPTVNVRTVTFADHTFRQVKISLLEKLQAHESFNITISGIRDCAGNMMSTPTKIAFGLPEPALKGDLVLNEILFNPRPNGVDFVEVVNVSGKYLNLKNWSLATIDDSGTLSDLNQICSEDFLVSPGRYLAITTDGSVLKSEYILSHESNFLIAEKLPSLPDDEGHLVLINTDSVMDAIHYNKDMHSVFIKDDEGVSLEKIAASSTNDRNNWTSGSAYAGYATPGYRNSNGYETDGQESIKVDPEIFQPGIGQPAFTMISYHFEQGGKIGNVKIFDSQGHLILDLANNFLLGTEGFFRWDGNRADGTKARVGYYMVWFEVFDASGNVYTIRKRLAVAGDF